MNSSILPHVVATPMAPATVEEIPVTVPQDCPEMFFQELPDGRQLQVQVPKGCQPGEQLMITYPVMNPEANFLVSGTQVASLGLKAGDPLLVTLGETGIVSQVEIPEFHIEGFMIKAPDQKDNVKPHADLNNNSIDWVAAQQKAKDMALAVKDRIANFDVARARTSLTKKVGDIKDMPQKDREKEALKMVKTGVKTSGKKAYGFMKKYGLDKKAVKGFNKLTPQQKGAVTATGIYFFGAPVIIAGAAVYGMSLN